MADSFVVHLGGGAYLDASGKIVFGPPDKAQIYQVPGGFRVDTKKIQEVFKTLSTILPADDEAKKKWVKWGVPENLVNVLVKISGVASIAATAISVYVWAIGVALMVMKLMTEDEGMSPELAKTLYSIKNQFHGHEQIERASKMIAMHAEFDGRINRMNGHLTRLAVEKPVGAARAGIFAEMQSILDELAVPLSQVRNQEWAVTYNADAYKGRGFASQLLVFERSDGTTPNVPMHSQTVTHFDYRLGVPMLLYAATTFAALAQVAMPWFRSAGVYADQLRKTADAIDRFVIRMQDEAISHTMYSREVVYSQLYWPITEIPITEMPSILGHNKYILDPYPTIAVGAFDLVRYDDIFLYDREIEQVKAGENHGIRGLFNYHWYTPLLDWFEGVDIDEAVAAANEQAKEDYANLQAATGMLTLVSTAAWLRFLSTPPDRSQTVSGWAIDSRSEMDKAPTTATSPKIFPGVVIEHDATLKRYNASNCIRITTQEPGYVPAFRYRIVLRTIDSLTGNEGWDKQSYVGDIWRADYEKTVDDPRLNRLRTEFRRNSILSEIVLYEGPSPVDAIPKKGEMTIRASTFDWYVPVWSIWSSYLQDGAMEQIAAGGGGNKATTATGGVSVHLMGASHSSTAANAVTRRRFISQPLEVVSTGIAPPTMQVRGGSGPLAASTVDEFSNELFALPGASLDMAERRHVRIEEVSLSWQLDWKRERLEVRLWGKPENRPFQVHVIVEETVYSGEVAAQDIANPLADKRLREQIHTPFVAEMVNQLVMVPEDFFVEERKALAAGAEMWNKFNSKYAKSRPIGPRDPIEFLDRSIREMAIRSQSTATLAATIDKQVEFAVREAPELWAAVLKESQAPRASSLQTDFSSAADALFETGLKRMETPGPKLEVAKVDLLPPARPEVVFTSVSHLTRWALLVDVRRTPIRLRLNLSALSQQEHIHWQQRLEHSHNDSGFSAAAVSSLGLIVLMIVYAAVIGFEQSLWLIELGTVVAAIVALVVGKVIGRVWSRRKLQRQVAQLVHLVEGRSEDGSPT